MDAVVNVSWEKTELNRVASELQPLATLANSAATTIRAIGSPDFGEALLRMTRPTYYSFTRGIIKAR